MDEFDSGSTRKNRRKPKIRDNPPSSNFWLAELIGGIIAFFAAP